MIIRNPQNSIGSYFGQYSSPTPEVSGTSTLRICAKPTEQLVDSTIRRCLSTQQALLKPHSRSPIWQNPGAKVPELNAKPETKPRTPKPEALYHPKPLNPLSPFPYPPPPLPKWRTRTTLRTRIVLLTTYATILCPTPRAKPDHVRLVSLTFAQPPGTDTGQRLRMSRAILRYARDK